MITGDKHCGQTVNFEFMEKELILFEERQYFRQNWMWWLVGYTFVVNITIILLGSGQKEDPSVRWTVAGLLGALMVPVNLLMYFQNLHTVITQKGISFRFRPYHFRYQYIPWSVVEKAWVRKYKPLTEFGGWGIRIAFRNRRAYNVSGNMG